MDYNEFKELITDYVLEKLSSEKQEEFELFISDNPQFLSEIDDLKFIANKINDSEIPKPSEKMDTVFYNSLRKHKEKNENFNNSFIKTIKSYFSITNNNELTRQIIYGLAILTIGLFIGYKLNFTANSITKDFNYAISETEKVRSQLVLELIDQPSANKRLQAINEANKLNNATEIVVKALFTTLNNDTNVNVRLASIESLAKYTKNPTVREGLVSSIIKQESPLVQIALADLMVALQEKTSINSMEKLLGQPNIDSTVKQKLQESIQEII